MEDKRERSFWFSNDRKFGALFCWKKGVLKEIEFLLQNWMDSNWATHTLTHLQMDFGDGGTLLLLVKGPSLPSTSPHALNRTLPDPSFPHTHTLSPSQHKHIHLFFSLPFNFSQVRGDFFFSSFMAFKVVHWKRGAYMGKLGREGQSVDGGRWWILRCLSL